jgi:crotonobetainyl-CoA:carnitine CoA-transferase CaiB-like acyl-CoA transferase
MIRTIVCDKTTAVFTAQAVAAALYAREKTGQGDNIQVAMLDAMISYLWPEGMMQYTVVGAETTAADPNDRPDIVFKTSDGYITAGTISDSEWQGFCRASGDPELARDPRFATHRRVRSTPRPASTRWRSISASTPLPNGWSAWTPPTSLARRSCGEAR